MKTTSLCSVWKKEFFLQYYINSEPCMVRYIPKVIKITININNNEGTTPFCHVLCLGMHSNVMHRFMVQAFQDAPFCSSTIHFHIAAHYFLEWPRKQHKSEITELLLSGNSRENVSTFKIQNMSQMSRYFLEYFRGNFRFRFPKEHFRPNSTCAVTGDVCRASSAVAAMTVRAAPRTSGSGWTSSFNRRPASCRDTEAWAKNVEASWKENKIKID